MFTNTESLSTVLSTGIPQKRSIYAIFVHFGSPEVTQKAIASLFAGTMRPSYIIVVDHAETLFVCKGDDVVIIRPEINTGYFGGLQVGIAHAVDSGAKKTDLCLLLNNDIVFEPHSLQTISHWWDVCGSSQVLAGASLGSVSLLSGRARIFSTKEVVKTWGVIPYIHGSCIIGEFGLLTSLEIPVSLFMYWEDVLLSILVRQKSGVLRVIPSLEAIHNDRPSSISLSKLFYLVRNGAYVLETYSPSLWRVYWYIINTIRMAYHACMDGNKHRIIVRALRDARHKKLGKAKL